MAADDTTVQPGDMPKAIILTVDEAFDVLEAMEGCEAVVEVMGDFETFSRLIIAIGIIRSALGAEGEG